MTAMIMDNGRHGARHPLAAFTQAEAQAIRRRYREGGVSLRTLAHETGACPATIRKIVRGLSYRADNRSGR